MTRTVRQIRRDRDSYLDIASLLLEIRDMVGYAKYLEHVRAMDRELTMRRCGAANAI